MDTQSGQPFSDSVLPVPRVMLEAGNEQMNTLRTLLARRLDEIAGGQVIQVVSSEPGTCAELPMWCLGQGHELMHVKTDGEQTRFWIRKHRTNPP